LDKHQALQRDARRKMMLEEPVAKVIPILAIPMIIAMLIDSIYNITDTYFVSQLGTSATAAVGVNDSLMQLIRSVAMGFGIGASSYISRLLGAKEYEKASKVGSTALLSALIIIAGVAAIGYAFINPLVVLLGATPTAKPYSVQYASFILLSAPFTAGTVVLSQLLRSEGSTQYSMIGMVSGCVINISLDPLFINVLGLGIAGAVIATGISKMISFSILLVPFLRNKTLIELKFKLFTPKKYIYAEIVKMGIPTFLRSSMLALSTIVLNNYAGGFGDTALAAVSVANKCTRLIGAAIIGLGMGFQPLAGYCWGAKRYDRVRKAFWTCSGMGVAGAVVLGTVMALGAPKLIQIFASTDNTELVTLGAYIIIAQCITMPLHVWSMIANGLFQALGRPWGAGVLGLSRQLICLVPSVIVLSQLFGVYGLASAQAVSDVLTMCIAVPMVLLLMKKIKVLENNNNPAQNGLQPNSSFNR